MILKQSLLLYFTGVEVVFGSYWDHLTKVNLIPNLKKKKQQHLLFAAFIFDSVWIYGSFWALGGALRWEHMKLWKWNAKSKKNKG